MKNFSSFFLAATLLVSSFPGGSGQQEVCKVWERQLRNGTCVNCGYGEVSSSTRLFCLPCYPGFVRGERDGSFLSDCVSAAGICEPYEWAIFGKCSSCPYGMVSTADKKRCVFCPDGLIRGNRDGSALSDCVDASKLCLPNERAWRGTCNRCGKGEVSLDSDKKICTPCKISPKVQKDRCFFDVNPQTFRASDDLMNTATMNEFKPTTALSVSVRMKLTTIPTNFAYIVSRGWYACEHGSYSLYFNNNKELKFSIASGSDNRYVTDRISAENPDAPSLVPNKWHHVVGTFDENEVKLYLDGALYGRKAAAGVSISYVGNDNNLTIGYFGGPCPSPFGLLSGAGSGATLSELCFFNTSLTTTEINELNTQCGYVISM